jgi:hypothetical protein
MTYEHIPQRLRKEHRDCIHCEKPYEAFLGGIVWDGYKRQYFICGTCAHYVVPAIANDYATLVHEQMDLGVKHKGSVVCFRPTTWVRRLGYFNRVIDAFNLWGIGST